MLRLIQKQPLQAVDLHPVIDPVADRVDVQISERVERSALPPDRQQTIGAFETRTENHAYDRDGRGPGAVDEMADEEVEESDEGEADRERVDEENLLDSDAPACRTMLHGGQQMHQPVVVQVVVDVVRIARRHVAFAHLRNNRHFPDEIRSEVRAIRTSFRKIDADVRIRTREHRRNRQQ